MIIVLLLVGSAIVLVLIGLSIPFFVEKTMSAIVGSKHEDADMILASGYAPPEWGKRLLFRLGTERLSRYFARRRLKKIINYCRHSPMVENEQTRMDILTRLSKIRKEWRKRSWKEIYPYEDES